MVPIRLPGKTPTSVSLTPAGKPASHPASKPTAKPKITNKRGLPNSEEKPRKAQKTTFASTAPEKKSTKVNTLITKPSTVIEISGDSTLNNVSEGPSKISTAPQESVPEKDISGNPPGPAEESEEDQPIVMVRYQHSQKEKNELAEKFAAEKQKNDKLEETLKEAAEAWAINAEKMFKKKDADVLEFRKKLEMAIAIEATAKVAAQNKLEKTEDELAQVKKELHETKAQLDQTKEDLKGVKDKFAQAEDASNAQEKVRDLEEELEITQEELEETKQKLEETRGELEGTEEELEETKEELEDIKEELKSTKMESDAIQEELDDTTDDFNRAVESHSVTERDLKQANDALTNALREIETLKKAATEREEKLSNASSPERHTAEQRDEKLRNSFLKIKRKYDSLITICKDVSALTRGIPLSMWGEFGITMNRLRAQLEERESGAEMVKTEAKQE